MSLLHQVEWEAHTGRCRWSTATFENSCGCPALDMPEWREMTEEIVWQATQNHLKWFASQKIWSVEKLETLPTGTKPRALHHWRLKERGVERGSTAWSSLKGWERATVNQTNSGTVSKATLGKLLRGRMDFSKCIDTILNWTHMRTHTHTQYTCTHTHTQCIATPSIRNKKYHPAPNEDHYHIGCLWSNICFTTCVAYQWALAPNGKRILAELTKENHWLGGRLCQHGRILSADI